MKSVCYPVLAVMVRWHIQWRGAKPVVKIGFNDGSGVQAMNRVSIFSRSALIIFQRITANGWPAMTIMLYLLAEATTMLIWAIMIVSSWEEQSLFLPGFMCHLWAIMPWFPSRILMATLFS